MSVKWTIAKQDSTAVHEEYKTVIEGVEIEHMTSVKLGYDQVFYFIDPDQVKEFDFQNFTVPSTGKEIIRVYRDMKMIGTIECLDSYNEKYSGTYVLHFFGWRRPAVALGICTEDQARDRAEEYIKANYEEPKS